LLPDLESRTVKDMKEKKGGLEGGKRGKERAPAGLVNSFV
jgi:hypothetical protein